MVVRIGNRMVRGAVAFMRIAAFLALLCLSAPTLTAAASAGAAAAEPRLPALMQFKTGGHMVGFQARRFYIAALDHALSVEFTGGAEVMPHATAGPAAGSPSGAPELGSVTYENVWDRVSVRIEAAAEGIAKSTYLLAPGADSAAIRLTYNQPVRIQDDGSLIFQASDPRAPAREEPTASAPSGGYMSESAPEAWQWTDGERVPVVVRFTLLAENQVGFSLGEHDPGTAVTIDPTYQWHSFYGGFSVDSGNAIAVALSGNVYITGSSNQPWVGDGNTSPKNNYAAGADIVVVKLDQHGNYQWHTFYGSGGTDIGNGIALDAAENVYVTGDSDATWLSSALRAHSGGLDTFVLKLNTDGAHVWHTFYGSSGFDIANAIEVDASGFLAVTGYSNATWQGDGANPNPKNAFNGGTDIFVLRLSTDGAYQWHTFYGGAGSDVGWGIAVETTIAANIYVTGHSEGTWGANPLHSHGAGSGNDIVVFKLTKLGGLVWNTFYGSSATDAGFAIALDGSNNVYVSGQSMATWLGDSNAGPQHAYTGGIDIVALKLTTNGAYQWHTFYGSDSSDGAKGIAVTTGGDVSITGYSAATWLGDGSVTPRHPYTGNLDLVVLALNTSGKYMYHTFYGSADFDSGSGIAVDSIGNINVVGSSQTTWQGDVNANPKHAHSGILDSVVLNLSVAFGMYEWHTFYGSVSHDVSTGIAVDHDGNVYITGSSRSSWLGDGSASPKHAFGGLSEIIVVKLNSSGVYQWHTFYGSSTKDDVGTGIAVDGSENVYVVGEANASWQGDGNAIPKHAWAGLFDSFVLKLDTNGAYQWHTFHGTADTGEDIVVDANGNAFVTGQSSAAWLGDGGIIPRHAHSTGYDIVVYKLASNGAYQWHTFWGGAGGDVYGNAIALDTSGNVLVAGKTDMTWQGSGASPKHAYTPNGSDIVVLKLDPLGIYQWHTFYGSSAHDQAAGIGTDASENVYVTGTSVTSWLGDNGASPLHAFTALSDVFVLKLDRSGVYQWHSFYGSGGVDQAQGLAVDAMGNVYVTGTSEASWLGNGGTNPQHAFSAYIDLYLLKLKSSGAYAWHTFYGAESMDDGKGVAVDPIGNVYVGGASAATWQGDGNTNPLHPFMDGGEILMLKLADWRAVSVTRNGTGSGTVTTADLAIQCGSNCSETVDYGSVVTLTAVPASGSFFAGWNGAGCTGTGQCVIAADAPKNVTATFDKATLYLPLILRK